MRITLIEPAPPGFHVWSFTRQVRLGLPLIGTMLRDLGHDVRIYVESLGAVDWERVFGSDVVGMSTHGWEKVPKNRTYLRQLRAFSEARKPVSILGSM